MKLNSAQLDAFSTVARTLNFTRAAEALHVTQSALSQRIAKLEEELETTLFIRDRSALRLTEAGELVLRFCRLNESTESELLDKLKSSKDDLAGVIRIGGFSSVNRSLVIPALASVMGKNPRLSIQLMTKELRELDGLLKSAEAEYIITNHKSESSEIESVFLGYEENVLVKLKKSPATQIFLDHDESDATTRGYLAQNKSALKISGMRYLDDVYGLIDGVKNGYGNAILPLHLIENEKDLEVIAPRQVLVVSVYLQYYLQPHYRRVHAVLVSELQKYFHQRLRTKR